MSIDLWPIQIPDPDKRLTKTNEKCERFYGTFKNFLTKWYTAAIVLSCVASVLMCQLKYGRIEYTELFHPVKAV